MNELWKPGRKIKLNDQDLKKKNELWKPRRKAKLNDQDLKKRMKKPGCEMKLNDQDLKKGTNYGQGPDSNQIQIRFKSDSNRSEPDLNQIKSDLIRFKSNQIY
ncbi:hypothetical protein C1646_769448 [Rhizophagus diaphanus]|nr:hypothetical protein C1646_769448 [Rhizophagus diaphanus] [Rhizophagus sp. MUCL 43196]